MSPVLVVITTTLILGLLLLQFLLHFYTCVFFYVNLLACRKHLRECAPLGTLLFEYVHAIITLRACTRGKVIGSARLSAQKNVRSRHSDVTSSQWKRQKKMLLLDSQALCVACELYKSLAIVDHAYQPNLLPQLLLHVLTLCSKMQYLQVQAAGTYHKNVYAYVIRVGASICIVHII